MSRFWVGVLCGVFAGGISATFAIGLLVERHLLPRRQWITGQATARGD